MPRGRLFASGRCRSCAALTRSWHGVPAAPAGETTAGSRSSCLAATSSGSQGLAGSFGIALFAVGGRPHRISPKARPSSRPTSCCSAASGLFLLLPTLCGASCRSSRSASIARAGPTSSSSSTRRGAWASPDVPGQKVLKQVEEARRADPQAGAGPAAREDPGARRGSRPARRREDDADRTRSEDLTGEAHLLREAAGRSCDSAKLAADPAAARPSALVADRTTATGSEFVHDRRMSVHLYQLDVNGRAVKLAATASTAPPTSTTTTDPNQLERVAGGIAD